MKNDRQPVRLRDDGRLSAELRRDLVDIGADVPYDVQAGHRRLLATISAAGAAGLAAGSGAASAATSSAATNASLVAGGASAVPAGGVAAAGGVKVLLGSKLGVVATTMVAAGAIGTAVSVSSLPQPEKSNGAATAVQALDAPRLPAVVEPAAEPEATTLESEPSEPEPIRDKRREAKLVPPTSSKPAAQPVATGNPLSEEVAALARLRALSTSAPARALVEARRDQQRFSGGVFGQERQAIIVFALDRIGKRQQARLEAERFLKRYPSGPFSERVRAILEP